MTPAKSVKLIKRRSDRQLDDSGFKGPSAYGSSIETKLGHICLLNIFLMYNFELTWPGLAMSDQD